MRARAVGTVLIAGLLVFAGPAWSQSRGSGHSGGMHSFTGGHASGGGNSSRSGHSSAGRQPASGGHHGPVGHGVPAAQPHGNHHPGLPFHGSGHFGWHGPSFWGGLYLSFPLWWDAYWAWGWPFGYYGYHGAYGYYDLYDYPYGYPDSSIFVVPPDSAAAGAGSGDASAAVSSETTTAIPGASPVDMEVSPRSALVYLNGVLVGSVDEFDGHPEYLYLDPGRYTLDLRLPGYRSKSLNLSVGGENKVVLRVDLQVDPAGGAEGAPTPSPGLPHGRRFGPSFGPAATQATPSPGGAGAIQPAASASGFTALELRVSPPGAAVYLDGALIGTGDDLARLGQGVVVSPGPHRIDVVAPGHTGKTVQVNAEAGKKLALSVALE